MAGSPQVSVSYSTGGKYSSAWVQRVRAFMWIPQALSGLFLLTLGLWIGRDHLDLIRHGQSARGRIVTFKEEHWKPNLNRMPVTALIPIVEFPVAGRTIRFEDWLGGRRSEFKDASVPVLYLPARPSTAMIDRPLWNWIPWAPIAAVGLLLLFAALRGVGLMLREKF